MNRIDRLEAKIAADEERLRMSYMRKDPHGAALLVAYKALASLDWNGPAQTLVENLRELIVKWEPSK